MKLASNDFTIPDHLFISYASEDWILAEWLALKLVSEGYKVWYDRIKLLGGESYPRDITAAIKNQTFRVLALLSRNSIEKPNPVKERTLALNIAKDRKIDFLIPINDDGLKATELDFMTSDLTFIPFEKSWFEGICALLKKLQQINAPRNQLRGQQVISEWLLTEEQPKKREEVMWSNLLPILEMPKVIRKYSVVPEVDIESKFPNWTFYRESEKNIWAFSPPETSSRDWLKETSHVDLQHLNYYTGATPVNVLTVLLHRSIDLLLLNKGLKTKDGVFYFPNNLVSNNRLPFKRYDERKCYVKAVGERKFRVVQQRARASNSALAEDNKPASGRSFSPAFSRTPDAGGSAIQDISRSDRILLSAPATSKSLPTCPKPIEPLTNRIFFIQFPYLIDDAFL